MRLEVYCLGLKMSMASQKLCLMQMRRPFADALQEKGKNAQRETVRLAQRNVLKLLQGKQWARQTHHHRDSVLMIVTSACSAGEVVPGPGAGGGGDPPGRLSLLARL